MRFISRVLLIKLILSLMGGVYAQKVERLLTIDQLEALNSQISRHSVWIHRVGELSRGIHRPGGSRRIGLGLRLSPQHILTSAQWTSLEFGEQSVSFEVRCTSSSETNTINSPIDPHMNVVAKRIHYAPKVGVALLKTDRPVRCLASDSLASQNHPSHVPITSPINHRNVFQRLTRNLKQESTLHPGQSLYTHEPNLQRAARIVVASHATDQWAYYWLVSGALMEGTPLFDAHGRWVSMSVGIAPLAAKGLYGSTAPMSLVLPIRSIRQIHQDVLSQILTTL